MHASVTSFDCMAVAMYGRRDTVALYVLHCCYIPCLYTEQCFSVLSSRYKPVSLQVVPPGTSRHSLGLFPTACSVHVQGIVWPARPFLVNAGGARERNGLAYIAISSHLARDFQSINQSVIHSFVSNAGGRWEYYLKSYKRTVLSRK